MCRSWGGGGLFRVSMMLRIIIRTILKYNSLGILPQILQLQSTICLIGQCNTTMWFIGLLANAIPFL